MVIVHYMSSVGKWQVLKETQYIVGQGESRPKKESKKQ